MAKESNMHTTQTEIKAIAKAVGASLGRHGHKVPQSALLHALAAALDKRDWQTLKSSVFGSPVAAPQEQLTNELPSSYSDQARFWVRLAYFCGKPLTSIPDRSEEAYRIAHENVGPTQNGVLRWAGWNIPADFKFADSTLDAGDFFPESGQVGTFSMRFSKGELKLEVAFQKDLGWYATKAGTAMVYTQLEALVSDEDVIDAAEAVKTTPSLPGPVVMARFFTDDRTFETDFDAQAYLMAATDENLIDIINVGFSGDYCTDNIAEYFGDKKLNEDIVDGFAYLNSVNQSRTRETIGFECRVDGEAFLSWMHQHRPLVLARLLCERAGVHFEQAQEEEIKGKWDWLGENGNACDCSFDTEDEAILDAYQQLGLLESECTEAPSFG